jgi:hypothetical protein
MRKSVLLFLTVLVASSLLAQNRQITGTVTGSDEAPVTGAMVTVQGTNTAVVTDGAGIYSINAPANATLDFAFFGMVSQSVAIGDRSVINIVLQSDSEVIDDVIVVAYGTARKSTFTGAASSVNTVAVMKDLPSMSFENALQGSAPGISVGQPSGQP